MDIPLSIFLVFCGIKTQPVIITFERLEAKAYRCAAKRVEEHDALPFLLFEHKQSEARMDKIIDEYLEWHEEVKP